MEDVSELEDKSKPEVRGNLVLVTISNLWNQADRGRQRQTGSLCSARVNQYQQLMLCLESEEPSHTHSSTHKANGRGVIPGYDAEEPVISRRLPS